MAVDVVCPPALLAARCLSLSPRAAKRIVTESAPHRHYRLIQRLAAQLRSTSSLARPDSNERTKIDHRTARSRPDPTTWMGVIGHHLAHVPGAPRERCVRRRAPSFFHLSPPPRPPRSSLETTRTPAQSLAAARRASRVRRGRGHAPLLAKVQEIGGGYLTRRG